MPDYVLDAVSANLAVLKSPTVLRHESGDVWAWEGCFL
jgi:non-lysosomal glucosylceramidase